MRERTADTGHVREEPAETVEFVSDDDAAASLLTKWGAKDEPEGKSDEYEPNPDEVDPEDAPEDDEADPEGDPEEEPEGDPEEDPEEAEEEAPEAKTADDEAETEVRVGDAVHKVKVKDLKRLFGQEQALTQKSQEVAQLREAADRQFQRSAVSLQRQVEKAKAKRDDLMRINLTVLARDPRVSDEEIRLVQADQEAAKADVAFYEGELDDLVKEHDTEQAKARDVAFKGQVEAAKRVLTDPDHPLHIPKLFEGAYQRIMEYGVRQGIPAKEMSTEVNPLALNVLWKAMKYDAGQAALRAKGKRVEKTVKPARGVAKPGASAPRSDKAAVSRSLNRFRQTGSDEDGANYYLARTGAGRD